MLFHKLLLADKYSEQRRRQAMIMLIVMRTMRKSVCSSNALMIGFFSIEFQVRFQVWSYKYKILRLGIQRLSLQFDHLIILRCKPQRFECLFIGFQPTLKSVPFVRRPGNPYCNIEFGCPFRIKHRCRFQY